MKLTTTVLERANAIMLMVQMTATMPSCESEQERKDERGGGLGKAENPTKAAAKGIKRPGKLDRRTQKEASNAAQGSAGDSANAHRGGAVAANLVVNLG